MRIGVIALQGNVEEHVDALSRVFDGEVVKIKHKGIVPSCDAIVIPGGESTTLCRLAWSEGIAQEIIARAHAGMPILGTCAGLILLASRGDDEVRKTGQKLLGLMDTTVDRNAFGRQRESFEAALELPFINNGPFDAVFIRAPAIISAGDGVEVLARLDDFIVAAKQGNIVALAFHPELTNDTRVHEYFMEIVKNQSEN
ncbi:glutamine amidotransferase subunit PdxT [Methanocella paludicola SANAE]|uniref:Pyridoxal 5'-phosphate synthase subunit PdxT n=1 Tax=Methanocella paludicola (strain DSM 17711 / JCM 13418 / NBRC 101707 / SANAE) TaxID=304371 RepID=D1YZ64_METPS|nr:pyridoxal 5'-phosphate synthase glutaminase subunit PdxT [Methanocella paludicola]BAI61736.1 glutamine amidotransferase subunit PdxT [Methanocella paludicola SANAE]